MRGDGSVYRRGQRWWISYWLRGERFREPGGATETEAKRKLRARMNESHGDRFVGPREERVMVSDLLDSLIVHLETKGARSVRAYRYHLNPVREFFSLTRAVDLTTVRVEKFIQERLADGK